MKVKTSLRTNDRSTTDIYLKTVTLGKCFILTLCALFVIFSPKSWVDREANFFMMLIIITYIPLRYLWLQILLTVLADYMLTIMQLKHSNLTLPGNLYISNHTILSKTLILSKVLR